MDSLILLGVIGFIALVVWLGQRSSWPSIAGSLFIAAGISYMVYTYGKRKRERQGGEATSL